MRLFLSFLFVVSSFGLHSQILNQTGFSFNAHKTKTKDNKQLSTNTGELLGGTAEGFSAGISREWRLKKQLGLRVGLSYVSSEYMLNFNNLDESAILGEGSAIFGGILDGNFKFYRSEFIVPITVFQQIQIKKSRYSFRYGGGFSVGIPMVTSNEYTIFRPTSGIPATASFFISGTSFRDANASQAMSNVSFHTSFGFYMQGAARYSFLIEPYLRYAGHQFNLNLLEDKGRASIETGISFVLYFDRK